VLGDNGSSGKRPQPGAQIQSALLLAESDTREDPSERLLFAATILLVQDEVTGAVSVTALSECETEGASFKLDTNQLFTTVTLLKEELTVERQIRALAGALTSQERL